MNTSGKITEKIDTKVLLSTLWIVVMINMLKADILSLYIPGAADEVAKTAVSTGTPISQLMLGGAIMMEISTCHDHPFARIEVRGESLGQYHCQHHHDCVCCRWRSFLSTLHIHRSR